MGDYKRSPPIYWRSHERTKTGARLAGDKNLERLDRRTERWANFSGSEQSLHVGSTQTETTYRRAGAEFRTPVLRTIYLWSGLDSLKFEVVGVVKTAIRSI